jgi:hypothetical protein
MTVWELLWALVRHALRGEGAYPVYVVLEGLPDAVQHAVDDCDLMIVKTTTPRLQGDRFVVAVARQQPPASHRPDDGGHQS